MTISDRQKELIEEFSIFEDWMEKYEYIIDLGKDVEGVKEEDKSEDNLVRGCQSRVWLVPSFEEGKLHFEADSDAIITKGIIAILIRVYSNQSPKAILNANTDFIDKIGLKEHLSPTRANGLVSMIKQIKMYAVAFQTQLN